MGDGSLLLEEVLEGAGCRRATAPGCPGSSTLSNNRVASLLTGILKTLSQGVGWSSTSMAETSSGASAKDTGLLEAIDRLTTALDEKRPSGSFTADPAGDWGTDRPAVVATDTGATNWSPPVLVADWTAPVLVADWTSTGGATGGATEKESPV